MQLRSRPLCLLLLAATASSLVTVAQAAGPPLTKASYRQHAGVICMQAQTSLGKVTNVKPADQVLAVSRTYLASLRRLSPPASFTALNTELVGVVKGEVTRLAALVPLFNSGKLTLTQIANDATGSKLGARETVLWKKLGVPSCS